MSVFLYWISYGWLDIIFWHGWMVMIFCHGWLVMIFWQHNIWSGACAEWRCPVHWEGWVYVSRNAYTSAPQHTPTPTEGNMCVQQDHDNDNVSYFCNPLLSEKWTEHPFIYISSLLGFCNLASLNWSICYDVISSP